MYVVGSTAWTQRMVVSASTLPRGYQQHVLIPDAKCSNVTAGTTPRPKTVSNGGFINRRME